MNIVDIKQNNRKKIYFYIRENNFATKQDIAYDLQLSLPTVTQNLEYLCKAKLIGSNQKLSTKSGGRNPIAYSYIADAKVAIGLDITKHSINGVVMDLMGNVINRIFLKRDFRNNGEYFILLGNLVENMIDNIHLDRQKLLGIGIAMPGLINEEQGLVVDGRVISNTGISNKDFVKYIPYPTKLVHDSNASGFSEIWMSPEIHNAFYISLCNSIGGSVLVNDKVYMGDGLYSGEVGHMNLVPNGKPCYCGQRGCFDAYCNAERLANYSNDDLGLFFLRLKQGDELLQKVWNEYLDYLAIAVHDIRMLFGCKIILGGYVGAYMKDYMDLLCERVNAKNPFGENAHEFLLPCKNKVESVATGASLYFIDEFFKNFGKNPMED
ncbi:ROK family protein [Caproicibacter sp. BJN0012]|uniref:ROK family protein n=1 Tax=Caproicibacter sp. BJN0012 TaxID=3110227 RepID=UPI002E133EC9